MSRDSTAINSVRYDSRMVGNPCRFKHNGIVFLDEIDIVTARKPVRAALKGAECGPGYPRRTRSSP